MTKITRTTIELLSALERHLLLLSDYYNHCFHRGNTRYFGEIAGKLRLLVCNKRNNDALLMHVAQIFGLTERYRISKEGCILEGSEGATIDEYLDSVAVTINLDGEMVRISNKNEILLHAEKEGAAHEDLVHPAIFYRLKDAQGILVNDMCIHHVKIENTARYVLEIGKRILHDIQSGRVLKQPTEAHPRKHA